MAKRVTTLIKRLKKNIETPEMKILPGQLAFFFVLTIIPILSLILLVASNLHISTDLLNSLVKNDFPDALVGIIEFVSNMDGAKVNNIIFFVSALVLASNGTRSMILSSNRIYKIKDKGVIYDYVKSFFMLIVLIVLLLFIMIVPMFGDFIMKTITIFLDNPSLTEKLYMIYHVMNLPISWFFIFVSIKLLYTMAPDQRIPSYKVNYGAIFTSFSWLIFIKLYSVYLNVFGGYNNIYGSISSLIVLMWWIYFLSYLFVMGMALNVSKYENKNDLVEVRKKE